MTSVAYVERSRALRSGVRLRQWLMGQIPAVSGQVPLALDPSDVRRRHYRRALGWVVVSYGLVALAVIALGKVALLSPLYLAAILVHDVYSPISVTLVFYVLYVPLLVRVARYVRGLGGFRGGLLQAAMNEEQTFREGAEGWTVWQRTKSCVVFAVVHLWNLYVPLALLLSLALGGAYFMGVYLKTFRLRASREDALREAAATHYAFNRMAIACFGISAIVLVALYVAYALS